MGIRRVWLTLPLAGLPCRYTKSPEAVELMQRVKGVFDPNGILNPYKVLPQSVARHEPTAESYGEDGPAKAA